MGNGLYYRAFLVVTTQIALHYCLHSPFHAHTPIIIHAHWNTAVGAILSLGVVLKGTNMCQMTSLSLELNHLSDSCLWLMSWQHNRMFYCNVRIRKHVHVKYSKMGSKINFGPISISHWETVILLTELWKHPFSQLCWIIYQNWGGKKTYMSTESGFYVMPAARTTGCIRGSRENKHWRMSFLNTWCFSQPQIPKFARDTAKPIHSRPTCDFTL